MASVRSAVDSRAWGRGPRSFQERMREVAWARRSSDEGEVG